MRSSSFLSCTGAGRLSCIQRSLGRQWSLPHTMACSCPCTRDLPTPCPELHTPTQNCPPSLSPVSLHPRTTPVPGKFSWRRDGSAPALLG